MSRPQTVALEILDVLDQARSNNIPLDDLEQRLWRLLEEAGPQFPSILAGQVESLVPAIRELQRENIAFARGREVDENHGADALYHEVTGALGRYLG